MSTMIGSILTEVLPADYQAHRAHTDNGKAYKGNGCRYCDLAFAEREPKWTANGWQLGSARIVAEWAEAKHNTEMPSDE